MFDKFLKYCEKYKKSLEKFNEKVNRAKALFSKEVEGYTEFASVYKEKLKESESLFKKSLEYLKKNK